MKTDQEKTREELLAELADMRTRLDRLALEAGSAVGGRAVPECPESPTGLMQGMLESMPDPVYVVNGELTILRVNERLCAFLGLRREELIGRTFREVLPPAAAFVFMSNDERMFGQGGYDLDVEMLSDHAGMVRPYYSTRVVFPHPSTGNPLLAVIMRDASDLMEARQALAESNHFMHAVLDAVPQPLFVKDARGAYTFVNSAYESLLGKCKAEILGRTILDVYPDKDKAGALMASDSAMLSGEGPDSEISEDAFCFSDRIVRDMVLNKVMVRDTSGRAGSLVGTLFDVSRLKQVERKLAAALEDLDTIIENSLVGIMFVRNRVIVRVNQRFTEITGYSREELVGTEAHDLYLSPDMNQTLGRLLDAEAAAGPVVNQEHPLRRKDGVDVWCKILGKPLDPDQVSQGFIWILDDITELKKAQEFREDVDRMARHDLKTPLQGVIGYSTLLQEDDNLTQEQRWMLREIEKSGDQMIRMIDVSLRLFKLETKSYKVGSDPVDVADLVRKVRMELLSKSVFSGKDVECLLDGTPLAAGDVFKVRGDELLLYSMLANLVKNALEATPEDGKVQVRLERWDGVKIVVHNEMPVPEEIREAFFEKYATHGKQGGSGLGTFSAKLVAESHGGTISLATSESRGTSVTVRLPG